MIDDAALLRQYLDERSEAAFAELVRRHVDLVYTVASRWTGDEAAASRLTQEVFSELATEAGAVSRQSIPVGWLHATTQRRAGEGVARESSRALACTIDRALTGLADDDRSALLLHYHERRPLTEVGRALNLSEEAAGLCVRRALEKLRGRLALLGQRMGPGPLAAELEQQTLVSAPAGLAEKIPATAIGAAALAELPGQGTWYSPLVSLANSGTALGLAAALVIGGALAWSFRTNARLEAEITRLRGDAQVMAGLQRENRRLARLVSEAEDLRKEVVDLPRLRATLRPAEPPPASSTVSITIGAGGSLQWDNEDITPADLIARLQSFRVRYPAPDTSVFIRGGGAAFSAVTHVVNESRKAGIKQILVEGAPRADAGGWF